MAYDLYGNYIPDGGGFFRNLFRSGPTVGSMVSGYGEAPMVSAPSQLPVNYTGTSPDIFYRQVTTPQTMGDYTGLGSSSAPMQPLPTLPQTYEAGPGNPNFNKGALFNPQLEQGLANFQSKMPSGTLNTPTTGTFDTNLQKAFTQAAGAGSGAAGLGGAVSAVSKLNPYLAAGTAALGAIQTIGGLVGLARTKQPEGFKLTPKMQQAIGESESAARYGLGRQQLALAQQNQREAQNTQLFNARSLSGGNLSRAIFGANTFNRLMAGNQLAAQDFAAQQQKVNLRNQMYGQEQAIANQNVQLAQQDYARKQQAYGGAMSSGLTNLGSFFNLQNALRYNQTA